MGPAARRSTRSPWPGVTSEGPSRRRVPWGGTHLSFVYAQTCNTHVAAYRTWTLSSRGAALTAVSHADVFFHQHNCLPEGPCFAPILEHLECGM